MRKYPNIYEIKVTSQNEFKKNIKLAESNEDVILLFVRTDNNDILPITEFIDKPFKTIKLVYIGKELNKK